MKRNAETHEHETQETLQCTIMVVSIEIADNIRQVVPLERVGIANVMVPCGRGMEKTGQREIGMTLHLNLTRLSNVYIFPRYR